MSMLRQHIQTKKEKQDQFRQLFDRLTPVVQESLSLFVQFYYDTLLKIQYTHYHGFWMSQQGLGAMGDQIHINLTGTGFDIAIWSRYPTQRRRAYIEITGHTQEALEEGLIAIAEQAGL